MVRKLDNAVNPKNENKNNLNAEEVTNAWFLIIIAREVIVSKSMLKMKTDEQVKKKFQQF